MYFQKDANNYGGMFTVAPSEQLNSNGTIFPDGYVALAGRFMTHLLAIDGGRTCTKAAEISSTIGQQYDHGILCRRPLRPLKIYTKGLTYSSAQKLKMELWQNGSKIVTFLMPFHQISADGQTHWQGYALPVIPGTPWVEYKLALEDGSAVCIHACV